MHPILNHAFHACQSELETVDTTLAQLHPEGRPHLPSVQQSVERYITATRQACELLEKRLKKGRIPHATRRSRLEWALQLMILSLGYVPEGTPLLEEEEEAVPVMFEALSGRELAKRLGAEVAEMDQLLDMCRRAFGMERIEHHPLLGPMRVDQWRRCQYLQLHSLRMQIAGTRDSMLQPMHQPVHRAVRA